MGRCKREYQWDGYSPRNTVHVVGVGLTAEAAKRAAVEAAARVVDRRPETGPLWKWCFRPSQSNNFN